MTNIEKCDCCGQFGGELETVTIQIKKHKDCDVNSLFGKIKVPIDLPRNFPSPADMLATGGVITEQPPINIGMSMDSINLEKAKMHG